MIAPAFVKKPRVSEQVQPGVPAEEVRLARGSLVCTAVGAIATIVGVIISILK